MKNIFLIGVRINYIFISAISDHYFFKLLYSVLNCLASSSLPKFNINYR
ncbi:hypothetical protein BBUWI9123_I0033 (plasmid) [Borreliella burgdorferi WI91-23]|nr:hypothetical protein BBUWI9123_I0033 [Borreliella burgdorferi WI91-23]